MSLKNWPRITGFIGVLVLVCGSFTHAVNSKIVDYENTAKTAENFLASENIYRLSFMSSLLMETIFIFYAFLLFQLLKLVNKNGALLMLILALIPAPVFFVNQLNHFAAFLLAQADTLELIPFYLDLHKNGGFIFSIFFGLWLFPLGYLVYKSTYLPKYLGLLLMLGCFGYLINCVQGLLFPGSESTLWTNPALVVTHLSEILFMLWLLVMGVNKEKYDEMLSRDLSR